MLTIVEDRVVAASVVADELGLLGQLDALTPDRRELTRARCRPSSRTHSAFPPSE